MNRKELDAFVEHHKLAPSGVEALLDLAGARPSATEQLHFAVRMLMLAGVLSLAAGVVFFIAANWDELRVLGRFVLLQILFVASIGLALWSPPPRAAGRFGLLAAFILAGALLALFGQTYQTGADVYELFLTWALLGLVLVIAGRWSVLWAAWLLVLNTSLALYCGWRPEGGLFSLLFSGFYISTSLLLMVPAIVNLGLWGLCESTRGTSLEGAFTQQVPGWLRRLGIAVTIAFGTWAGSLAIFEKWVSVTTPQTANVETLLLHAVVLAVIGFHTVRRRMDVFPLATIAASVIVLGTLGIARIADDDDAGTFFMLTAWLVVSSTLCSRLLLTLFRTWRGQEQPA